MLDGRTDGRTDGWIGWLVVLVPDLVFVRHAFATSLMV